MSTRNPDTTDAAALTWRQILNAVKVKTEDDIRNRLVPAVITGRSGLGTLLVRLGNSIKPKK